MLIKKPFLILLLSICFIGWNMISVFEADAETAILEPVRDNTLYENQTGILSNGSGSYLFVGNTKESLARRALMMFDIAGNIPAGSTITSVFLTLHMSRTVLGYQFIEIHRVLKDWGESSSDAPGEEGKGKNAGFGDATWIHTFFNTQFWDSPGGDFSNFVSAARTVGQAPSYTWGSTPQLVADVQDWLSNPAGNFGWMLLGNEASAQTTHRFDSREHGTVSYHPKLTVNYELPSEPPIEPPIEPPVEPPAGLACPDVPETGCYEAGVSLFALKNKNTAQKKLLWKWLRGDMPVEALGDPAADTGYVLCVYDESEMVPALVMEAAIPSGGVCSGRECWKSIGRKNPKGFIYGDKGLTEDGIQKILLKGGVPGRDSIQVKGRGPNLPLPDPVSSERFFNQDDKVIVQLLNSNGSCWTSEYSSARKNRGNQFQAR